ncbi:hypothetical protein GWK47_014715 [Chionoecetes opilio]|uniref:DEP domain-containing protein n=1 Tax=Chionoecetes opilio TaxID=41210 RepID=A0A8J4XW36_CHIOP|nr:hypothetical protein GWK47_014715 [Chionoecetes opilio]
MRLTVHLHRLRQSPDPHCPWCRNVSETIEHFLLQCSHFHSHCVVLRSQLLTLNVTTCDLPTLLAAAGVHPSRQHAVIRLTCAFLRKTVSEFVCEDDPAAPVVEELKESGILHDRRTSLFSSTKDVFTGQHFVDWIMKAKEVDEKEALDIGQDLLNKKYIMPLRKDVQTALMNDPKTNETSNSSALNAGPTQKCKLGDGGELSEALRRAMLKLTTDHISSDGKVFACVVIFGESLEVLVMALEALHEEAKPLGLAVSWPKTKVQVVNYEEMKNAEEFEDYVKMSKELQHVAVEKLAQDESKAFFINIYNALVIHATVMNGPPSNWFSRLRFFDKMCYIIGGHAYSLNDIENGVLRANKRGAAQIFAPFGSSDPRLKTSNIQVDPRIHFALNCGAKSCPPIKTFSGKNINEELRIATEAYLETDEALLLDENQGVIHLSSLLKWYSSDFGDTVDDVVQWVLHNVVQPKKKATLQNILDTKKYKVRYIPYDWGSNSHE